VGQSLAESGAEKMNRNQGGFTIVKVLSTVAALAVLSSIAGSAVSDSISRSQAEAQASVLGEIVRAKSQFRDEASSKGSPKPNSYTPLLSEIAPYLSEIAPSLSTDGVCLNSPTAFSRALCEHNPPLLDPLAQAFGVRNKVLRIGTLAQTPVWISPSFDISSPEALSAAIKGAPALRAAGGRPYRDYIASLDVALSEPNTSSAASAQLTVELFDALTNKTNLGADWSLAVLDDSFSGKGFDYSKTNITGTQLNGVSNLEGSNLSNLNLMNLDLTGKSARDINFSYSSIAVAPYLFVPDISICKPTSISLTKPEATVAKLVVATDLRGATLTGTGVTQTQLEDAWTAAGKDPALLDNITYPSLLPSGESVLLGG